MDDFKDFITENSGQFVEVTGSSNAKYQCVDLANAYIRDVLKLPIIAHANAQDFPKRGGDDYDFIPYRPGLTPQYGDLMIWDFPADNVGHIAIFINGNANNFNSFDQNYPLYSPCHIQSHDYKGVSGWMRSKHNQPNNDDMTTEQQQKLDAAYALVEAVEAGCKALRQRTSDGALFLDTAVYGKNPNAWADTTALAILMRMAKVPQIDEAESKKDKYVKVQSARQ